MKRLLSITLLALLALTAFAQSETPIVTARVEPDSIFIGDRFDYVIEIEKDQVQTTLFPDFTPPENGAVELIEVLPVDTLERDGRRMKIARRYRLAAFEEGLLNMGAAGVLYADKNIVDTLYARDSVYLKVATFEIDSTSQSIYDLKPQMTLQFKFAEIRGYLLWSLLILVLLGVGIYLLHRYLEERGRHLKDIFKKAPPEPPHVVAIKALEALHHQKLWQNNKHKLYYSLLTDILRTYIAGRWGVGAMEMTSDEILTAMRSIELPDKARMDLTSILMDGDLVKFAKFTPEAEQNESDYTKAYYFVEETKPVEVDPETENED
ncbi:MAG: hypothetical protein Q4A18_00810 [Rikenellaceae bacterium]|nr:hypothetical protein [Rikenellaceae bacterium]